MGAVFQIPWARQESWPGDLQALRAQGFTVAAMELTDAWTWTSPPPGIRPNSRWCWAQGAGMSPETLAAVDLAVRIRAGVDSLNVAAASAVAFWELRPRD